MTVSFEEILNMPSGDIKPPQPIPVGTYHVLIEGPPVHEESSQRKTPCRVYKFKILSPQGDVDQRQAAEQQVVGKIITGQGAGAAFYLTPEAAYRYVEFLVEHLGIDNDGGRKSLTEMEAEAPGRQCFIKIKHDIGQDGKRVFHRIESTARV